MNRSEQLSLSQNGKRHADIRRIRYVAVQRRSNEELRGRNRRGCAQSSRREFPRAAEVDCGSNYECNAADPRQNAILGGWRTLPAATEESESRPSPAQES